MVTENNTESESPLLHKPVGTLKSDPMSLDVLLARDFMAQVDRFAIARFSFRFLIVVIDLVSFSNLPRHKFATITIISLSTCAWCFEEYRDLIRLEKTYKILINQNMKHLQNHLIDYFNSVDLRARFLLSFEPRFVEPILWFLVSSSIILLSKR